jgi:hypothetical protein
MVRFIAGWVLLGRRPWDDPLFGQTINLRQQRGAAFDPLRPRALIAPILRAPLPHGSPVRDRHGVKARSTLLAAGEHPSFVEFALRAATRGLAAFSTKTIERPWHHGRGAQEFSENTSQGCEGTAELLPKFGKLRAGHLYHEYMYSIQIASAKNLLESKSHHCALSPPECFSFRASFASFPTV